MKTNGLITAAALAAGAFVSLTHAQTPAPSPQPAPESSQVQANAQLQPNQTVYIARLPTAQELTTSASAQGLTVDRIEQNANSVIAAYRTKDGRINVVSYQVLPAGGPAGTTTGTVTSGTVTTAPSSSTTVVYAPSPSVVYYDADPFYYGPWYGYGYGYPRVSVGIGLGVGGYRGGFHHWHR